MIKLLQKLTTPIKKAAWYLLTVLLLAIAIKIAWRFIWTPAQIISGISQIMGVPETSAIKSFAFEKQEISEISTVKLPLLIQYFARKGPGIEMLDSTLTLQGSYEVKVGFDVNSKFAVSLDRYSLNATVLLPQPKILSVEQKDIQVLASDQSLWSSFTHQEQTVAINGMNDYARASADRESLYKSAISVLRERLENIASL